MTKFVRTLVTAVAMAAMSMPAFADDDDDDDNRSSRAEQIREFFRCAYTRPVHFDGTIVDAAIATPDLSILTQAVVDAGLAETLSGEGPFTVYAPLNSAFLNIPADVLGAITGDVNILAAVLTYHVAEGAGWRNDPRRVFNNRIAQIRTVQGQQLFFSRDRDGTEINQSNLVTCQPVRTDNGVVYLIDSVLLPQF